MGQAIQHLSERGKVITETVGDKMRERGQLRKNQDWGCKKGRTKV
jgi:hypothetical protein